MIEVRGLKVAFGALAGVDLDVREGELLCLLGPSGCGKSTLLNVIAGFIPPSEGSVRVGGTAVTKPGPDRAVVFQEYALFPWMNVEDNVGFGLRERGVDPRETVGRLLATMSLQDFARRWPRELSGGMRQRVALARALALDAPVLLMDEPFGALDALTRRSMQDELLRILSERRPTILFVTHGIEESLVLGDRVAVMTSRPGRVKRIVEVTMPRPRDALSPEFLALQRELTGLVMEEQERHLREELGRR